MIKGLFVDILFSVVLIVGLVVFHELVHVAILYDWGCTDVGFTWVDVGPAVTYNDGCFDTVKELDNAQFMNGLFHVIHYALTPIYLLLFLIWITKTKNG